MKNLMLLTLLFMLMSPTISLCQSRSKQKKQKYPAVRIENKDTVVVFSIKQTRAIDQSYKQLKLQLDSIKTACNVVVDSLNNKVSNLYTVNDSLYKSNLKLLSIVSLTTTKVDDRVYAEMEPYFKQYYGNPSSLHSFGHIASTKIEEARGKVAALINADQEEIYFTSCGTESNNFALWGIARALKDKGNHIITSAIEHYSILNHLTMNDWSYC